MVPGIHTRIGIVPMVFLNTHLSCSICWRSSCNDLAYFFFVWNTPNSWNTQLSNEKNLGCLGCLEDYTTNYMGLLISQYKDPYKPTSIFESRRFFFVAQFPVPMNPRKRSPKFNKKPPSEWKTSRRWNQFLTIHRAFQLVAFWIRECTKIRCLCLLQLWGN